MDLGKWLRSRQEDVANTVDNIRQAPNRLLDLFDGPQKAQAQKAPQINRLRFQSGDQQLNSGTQKDSNNLFNGLTFGNGITGYNPKSTVEMPSFIPGAQLERYEDGSSELIGRPIDRRIYVAPNTPKLKPVPYRDPLEEFRRSI